MTTRHRQFFHTWQTTHTGDAHIITGLTKERRMALRPHLVEDNTGKAQILPQRGETMDQSSSTVCHAAGIDNQEDGDIQQPGNLRRAALTTVVTVEESHHALHHLRIHAFSIVMEDITEVLLTHKTSIEVDRCHTARHLMVLRVDIVGTALIGLYGQSSVYQGAQQSHGNGGFSTT